MARNERTSGRSSPRMLDYLATDRKKVILAVGLVTIMVVMWVRVLAGKKVKPAAAAATPPAGQSAEPQPAKLKFFELPVVAGRHDAIYRDFFSVDALAGFRRDPASQQTGADPEVRIEPGPQIQEVINRVAQNRLRLEAVLDGSQVFINDRLVGVGETLSVTEGPAVYVFEVVRIEEESVLVKCNGREVTLKLAP